MQFREGHFYLQDVSTNGVYVNDDMEPLAKRGSAGYRLATGDVLRMGEYHILAALESRGERQQPATAAVPTSIHALRTLGVTTELYVYPSEGHLLRNPAHVLDLRQRLPAWFDRYLKPAG